MAHDDPDMEYRGDQLAKITAAIRPRVPMTPGKQEATIQALAVTMATTFLARSGIPYSKESVQAVANEAMAAMDNWAETWGKRN